MGCAGSSPECTGASRPVHLMRDLCNPPSAPGRENARLRRLFRIPDWQVPGDSFVGYENL
jgi:hypothetical protein